MHFNITSHYPVNTHNVISDYPVTMHNVISDYPVTTQNVISEYLSDYPVTMPFKVTLVDSKSDATGFSISTPKETIKVPAVYLFSFFCSLCLLPSLFLSLPLSLFLYTSTFTLKRFLSRNFAPHFCRAFILIYLDYRF